MNLFLIRIGLSEHFTQVHHPAGCSGIHLASGAKQGSVLHPDEHHGPPLRKHRDAIEPSFSWAFLTAVLAVRNVTFRAISGLLLHCCELHVQPWLSRLPVFDTGSSV